MVLAEDTFTHSREEIEAKQLVAADALFQELRGRIPVPDRRAGADEE